jgi:diguanylate cyclase (GGDEF)-like protein
LANHAVNVGVSIELSSSNDPVIPKYTVSIGMATMVPQTPADMDKLIKQADQALLQAKRNGRNQIVQAD